MGLTEFSLIERFFASSTIQREDVALGIGDDAAIVQPSPGHDVVSAIKTFTEGVQFERGADAQALGQRVLASALSRLAGTGATPAWATLSLSLPAANETWLTRFSAGLSALARRHQVQLVGGDTVRGPLSITVVASGFVLQGRALQRSGARPGNLVYVTGTLGQAGLAVLAARGTVHLPQRLQHRCQIRLAQPEPRVAEAQRLSTIATAATDLPNGLLEGLTELADASGVGATVYLAALPLLPEMLPWLPAAGGRIFALHSGGDYELCITVPAEHQAEAEAAFAGMSCGGSWIGVVEAARGLRCVLEDGSLATLA